MIGIFPRNNGALMENPFRWGKWMPERGEIEMAFGTEGQAAGSRQCYGGADKKGAAAVHLMTSCRSGGWAEQKQRHVRFRTTQMVLGDLNTG